MKASEKLKTISVTLAIIALFALLQSPSLNTMSIIVAATLLYKYDYIKRLRADTVSTVADPDVGKKTEQVKCGVVVRTIDVSCLTLIFAELLVLPMMVLYLISPYQTFNAIFGLILGLSCLKFLHGKILRHIRIWIWFITFNLSLATLMVIIVLSR